MRAWDAGLAEEEVEGRLFIDFLAGIRSDLESKRKEVVEVGLGGGMIDQVEKEERRCGLEFESG